MKYLFLIGFIVVVAAISIIINYYTQEQAKPQHIGMYDDRKMNESLDASNGVGITPLFLTAYADSESVTVTTYDRNVDTHSIHSLLNRFANYTNDTMVRVVLVPSNTTIFSGTITELN